jgi:hypothetical protein
MMPARQVWIFKFACWVTFLTAAIHMVGHVAGSPPPANATEQQMPGGGERSILDFQTGFSLMFATMLATFGAVGLMVVKRGTEDPVLVRGVARAFALSSAVLLVISLTHFFIIPSLFIALMTVSFAVASVSER